jgi:hypothetical protein
MLAHGCRGVVNARQIEERGDVRHAAADLADEARACAAQLELGGRHALGAELVLELVNDNVVGRAVGRDAFRPERARDPCCRRRRCCRSAPTTRASANAMALLIEDVKYL